MDPVGNHRICLVLPDESAGLSALIDRRIIEEIGIASHFTPRLDRLKEVPETLGRLQLRRLAGR